MNKPLGFIAILIFGILTTASVSARAEEAVPAKSDDRETRLENVFLNLAKNDADTFDDLVEGAGNNLKDPKLSMGFEVGDGYMRARGYCHSRTNSEDGERKAVFNDPIGEKYLVKEGFYTIKDPSNLEKFVLVDKKAMMKSEREKEEFKYAFQKATVEDAALKMAISHAGSYLESRARFERARKTMDEIKKKALEQ